MAKGGCHSYSKSTLYLISSYLGGLCNMKLIRVCNKEGFKTYAKDKVERVSYRGKRYLVSRFVDYSKTNVLDLKKQKIVLAMMSKGADLAEIGKAIGVSEKTLNSFLSMQFKQENCKNGQVNSKQATCNCKKVKVVCFTDKSIIVYNSVTTASKAIGCSGSNISNYCRSGDLYKHRANGKEYKMSFLED